MNKKHDSDDEDIFFKLVRIYEYLLDKQIDLKLNYEYLAARQLLDNSNITRLPSSEKKLLKTHLNELSNPCTSFSKNIFNSNNEDQFQIGLMLQDSRDRNYAMLDKQIGRIIYESEPNDGVIDEIFNSVPNVKLVNSLKRRIITFIYNILEEHRIESIWGLTYYGSKKRFRRCIRANKQKSKIASPSDALCIARHNEKFLEPKYKNVKKDYLKKIERKEKPELTKKLTIKFYNKFVYKWLRDKDIELISKEEDKKRLEKTKEEKTKEEKTKEEKTKEEKTKEEKTKEEKTKEEKTKEEKTKEEKTKEEKTKEEKTKEEKTKEEKTKEEKTKEEKTKEEKTKEEKTKEEKTKEELTQSKELENLQKKIKELEQKMSSKNSRPEGIPAKAVPEGIPAKAVPEGIPAKAVPEGIPAKAVPEGIPAKAITKQYDVIKRYTKKSLVSNGNSNGTILYEKPKLTDFDNSSWKHIMRHEDNNFQYDPNLARRLGKLFKSIQGKKTETTDNTGIDIDFEELIQYKSGNLSNDFFLDVKFETGLDIVIAVDCSGSMAGTKIKTCRDLCATLFKSLENVNNVNLKVVGWSGKFREDRVYVHNINKYSELKFLTVERGYVSTPTNLAIQYCTEQLLKMNNMKKLLIILTDGHPNSPKYNTIQLIDLGNQAVNYASRRNISIFGIYVEDVIYYQNEANMQSMFQNNYVYCNNITQAKDKIIETFSNHVIKVLQ